jgi:hypothetical protein
MADPATDQPQTTSAEPTEPQRGGGGIWFLWLPLTAVVIYALSIGPVAKLAVTFDPTRNNRQLQRTLDTVYAPVGWCMDHSPHFSRLIDWYFSVVWHINLYRSTAAACTRQTARAAHLRHRYKLIFYPCPSVFIRGFHFRVFRDHIPRPQFAQRTSLVGAPISWRAWEASPVS